MIRTYLCRLILRMARWRIVGQAPRAGVLVGAPHTSNWDFALAILVLGATRLSPLIMIKKEAFVGPAAWFLRKVGGVPIDRRKPSGTVRALIERLGDQNGALVIAPEGTRKVTKYWKSGFYRIAEQADLPITLGFIDGPTRTAGFGPTFKPSGDLAADMEFVRAFYAGKRGLRPALRTEPALREEPRDRRPPAGDDPA